VTEIRIAEPGDLPALVASLGHEYFFTNHLGYQANGRGELFVAWDGPTPVGDVYLWRDRPHEPEVFQHLSWTPTLMHLEVAVAYQNRGIGTALIRAVEQHASALGYVQLCLGVGVNNAGARRLYERLGYVEWEARPGRGPLGVAGPGRGAGPDSETCHWLVRTLRGEAPGAALSVATGTGPP
jgi:ribosomal protein S18 acetylase RimI-like enzyme